MTKAERSSFALFFFSSRRRHTSFDCDWSSDVCSSDLVSAIRQRDRATLKSLQDILFHEIRATGQRLVIVEMNPVVPSVVPGQIEIAGDILKIGRASCRERW